MVTYFEEEELLSIFDDPRRVINGDESGFQLNPKGKFAYVARGSKEVIEVNSDPKTQMSVMFSLAADGYAFKPCIIFPGKRMTQTLKDSIPSDIDYDITETGWQNQQSFLRYIDLLDKQLNERQVPRPVVYFLDNHVSHLSYEVIVFSLFLSLSVTLYNSLFLFLFSYSSPTLLFLFI